MSGPQVDFKSAPPVGTTAGLPLIVPLKSERDTILRCREGADMSDIDGIIGMHELRNTRESPYGFHPICEDALVGASSSELRKTYAVLPENIRKLILALVCRELELKFGNLNPQEASTLCVVLAWRQGDLVTVDVGNIGDSEAFLITSKNAERLNQIIHNLPENERLGRRLNMYRVLGKNFLNPSHDMDFYTRTISASEDYAFIVGCDGLTESWKEHIGSSKANFVKNLWKSAARTSKSKKAWSIALSARKESIKTYDIENVDDISVGLLEKILNDIKLFGMLVADGNGGARNITLNELSNNIGEYFFPILKEITVLFVELYKLFLSKEKINPEDKTKILNIFKMLNTDLLTPPIKVIQNGSHRIPNSNPFTVDLTILKEWKRLLEAGSTPLLAEKQRLVEEKRSADEKIRKEAENVRMMAAKEKEAREKLRLENWAKLTKKPALCPFPSSEEIHKKAFNVKYAQPTFFKSLQYDSTHAIEQENLSQFTDKQLKAKIKDAVVGAVVTYHNEPTKWWRKKNYKKTKKFRADLANLSLADLINKINAYLPVSFFERSHSDSFKTILKKELDKISLLPLSEWCKYVVKTELKDNKTNSKH